MKRLCTIVAAALLTVALSGTASRARFAPTDEYDESQSHPLRLIAYAIHPIGFAAEWLIVRPIHAVVSLPGFDAVFGHYPHGEELMPAHTRARPVPKRTPARQEPHPPPQQ